jgi:hypothetical protein
MSNKVSVSEFKYEMKEINKYCSCIFADETNFNPKEYNINSEKYKKIYKDVFDFFYNAYKIGIKYRMLIVCTQNSKSCTQDHFQHLIKDIIKAIKPKADYSHIESYLEGIHLIDKADATSSKNSSFWSCPKSILEKKLPFNCRTRIYGNNQLYSDEYKNSDNKIIKDVIYKSSPPDIYINKDSGYPLHILKNISYKTHYIKTGEDWKRKIIINAAKSDIFVRKREKRIINISSEGFGAILFDIIIENVEGFHERFIICNSNLPADSSERILTDLKKKLKYSLPFNFIMATPNISEIEKINNENKAREIFPNNSFITTIPSQINTNILNTQIAKTGNGILNGKLNLIGNKNL